MSFLNNHSDGKKMVDKVFKAAIKAKEAKDKFGDDEVVDATLGTLFDEDGIFVAYDSVWGPYDQLDKVEKGRYARSIQGNPLYRDAVYKWLFGENEMPAEIIVSPGGAGAVSATMHNVLNPGDTVIKPSQGWGPYKTMANEFELKLDSYNLFKDGAFDIADFKDTLTKYMNIQGKVLAIINDPCHNPTGYTMSSDEWDQVLDFLNELSKQGPVVIINDIAYVDYSTDPSWKDHFLKYRNLAENVMIVITFSLSKTFTAYGARVGASVVVSSNKEELAKYKDAAIYSARSIWSTCNNSVMELFAKITTDETLYTNYINEKQYYIELLKERSRIFINECASEEIELYPFKEGFFATLKVVDDNEKEALNLRLQKSNIFTVEVDGGLRVALCSVPKRKLRGLARKIKKCM
ncbi:Aromatic-amino-acid aminotransferase [Candidatus Izimaplasma bacterium HR1]|jgi:aspartate aminotransferase/aromatic-amino-acid transaminase|uniref:pyridoxal phosphate-dependent aminotransferase n=1 Tax=Candidatus Izimoplasma sp. HR1 TaxID=1541959 RepID=UPI0004F7F9BF|nr:Aromatic-amino-acid aminotransferase [Candidatus Izimaplasma bacterium HR1]